MFHPVGSRPPSVYWRRRLVFFATLVVVVALLLITLRVVLGGSGGDPSAGPSASGHSGTTTPRTSSPASTGTSGGSSTPSTPTSSTSRTAATPKACAVSALSIQAASDKTSYQVGDMLHLMLEVTNTGSVSCVEDLADPQVVLTVYNGESRVWGSHDCAILPGTKDRILVPDAPVKVTVVWSGQSSKANDKHTTAACSPRQQVGAGTYTLGAALAGKQGTTSQFTIG